MSASLRDPLSPVALDFLEWAADDYVEAFVLRKSLERIRGSMSPEVEKVAALDALGELLEGGLIRVGEMKADVQGLAFWEGSNADIEARIESSWNIERPPGMGENPWFYATDDGKGLIKSRRW
jgi:hypothetical protein